MALWRNAWSGTQIPNSYNVNAIGFTPQAIRVQNYTGATLLVGTGPGTIGNGVLVPPYSSLPYLWTSSSVAWQFQGSYTPVSTDSILLELADSPLGSAAANLYNPIVQNTLLVPISFGPKGGIYQGSAGTFSSPNTGLKLYQDANGNGRIELWSGGTLIWEWDAVNGLVITMPTSFQSNRALTWEESGAVTASLAAELVGGLRSVFLGTGDNGNGGTPASGSDLIGILASVAFGVGASATAELQARNKSGTQYTSATLRSIVNDTQEYTESTAEFHTPSIEIGGVGPYTWKMGSAQLNGSGQATVTFSPAFASTVAMVQITGVTGGVPTSPFGVSTPTVSSVPVFGPANAFFYWLAIGL